jgi:hypothetical protein
VHASRPAATRFESGADDENVRAPRPSVLDDTANEGDALVGCVVWLTYLEQAHARDERGRKEREKVFVVPAFVDHEIDRR